MRTPLHLWFVGVASLLWNAMGAADYVMTQTRYAPYMSQFTEEQLAYFQNFPTWVVATWALAIWLSVAGSLSLLARHRTAPVIFGLAFIFMVVTAIHNFLLADVPMNEIAGPEALWFSAAIFVVGLLLWLYARWLRRRGVLR